MMTVPRPEESALDALLADYASGALSPALHALIGSHLELSANGRGFVSSLEDSLARRMETAVPAALRGRDARLAAIFAQAPASRRPSPDSGDPRALIRFAGKPIEQLAFTSLLPGVRECRIEAGEGSTAVIYRIRAGQRLPQHTHEGSEVTLVLRGGFSDEGGHYVRGDVAIADEHHDHVPVADADEECVCFAVMDAPLRLTGRFGRFFNRFLRH